MKLVSLLAILLLAGGPVFGEPTVWPADIDELYYLIDNGEGNWVFTQPCPADPGVSLMWRETKDMHADNEDALFYRAGLAYLFGELKSCKPPDDKVMFYGPALPALLELVESEL